MTEFSLKRERINDLLKSRRIDALLLLRASSFAWATCGAASYINTASSYGEAKLLITKDSHYLITNNIEATRLELEEKLKYQGWEFIVSPWHKDQDDVTHLVSGLKLGSDSPYPEAIDLSKDIAYLRSRLTAEEGVRFRVLGRLCAEAMDSAVRTVQPGQTEHQIAARLAFEAHSRGVQPIVNLIGSDERIYRFRHPLPTNKTLERYAMLVLCGRRWGLVCSLTRLVHIGALSQELRRRMEAVAQVDAALIHHTRPGVPLGQVFERGIAAYAASGFPDEWQLHHQGGPAGYEPREAVANPGASDLIATGQVYAWNPSITGTKSEDSVQIGESENEVITTIPGWPVQEIEIEDRVYQRPAILEFA